MGSVQSNDKTPKTPTVSLAQSPENTEAAASSSPGDSPVVETYPQTEVTEAPASPPCPSGDKSAAETEVVQVSEEQLAEIAQATKSLMEKPSGKSMEIVLSPAVKKQKSRVSPPTSPTSNVTQESIVQKLKSAEERRQSIESAKMQILTSKLAKITIAQQKKEEVEKEKVEKLQEAIDSKLTTADENKAKRLSDVKDKVSEHMQKIEKAQKELEASLEAARLAAEATLSEKMEKNEELKNLRMEDMLKKIKEHQEHVDQVRNNQEEKLKPYVEELQINIKAKEERARELREKKDAEMREKIAEQNKKAEIVRQNKEKLLLEGGDQTTESA